VRIEDFVLSAQSDAVKNQVQVSWAFLCQKKSRFNAPILSSPLFLVSMSLQALMKLAS
jgi:hypothetical protein